MSLTVILIAITALISYRAFTDHSLRERLIFYPVGIKDRGELYRFVTHGFIHADFNHLLFNMWALYIFGETAEFIFKTYLFKSAMVGGIMYVVFYLASIAAAGYVSFLRNQDNYSYRALGASGGVAAMMWPYILLAPWNWFIFPPLPAILLGPLYIAYSHYADKRGVGNVGHNAHLWGAIFGLIVYVILMVFRSPELVENFLVRVMSPEGPAF